jgi:hypothetical protein
MELTELDESSVLSMLILDQTNSWKRIHPKTYLCWILGYFCLIYYQGFDGLNPRFCILSTEEPIR